MNQCQVSSARCQVSNIILDFLLLLLNNDACSFVFVKTPAVKSSDANSLCLECGLCCNGVIFADGQLQPEDNAARLRELGLKLTATQNSKLKTQNFLQPCAAFGG